MLRYNKIHDGRDGGICIFNGGKGKGTNVVVLFDGIVLKLCGNFKIKTLKMI